MRPKKHGGKRKGAGRKPEDGAEALKPHCVYLDEVTVDKARQIGSGNLSAGIRKKFKED